MPIAARARKLRPSTVVAQGAAALAVSMGIGRFVYTPILPLMVREAGLSRSFGATLATANYAGYLLGALAGIVAPALVRSAGVMRGALLASIATLALMPVTHDHAAWFVLRFVAGGASALVFMFAVSAMLAHLRHASHLVGWGFGGVGAGHRSEISRMGRHRRVDPGRHLRAAGVGNLGGTRPPLDPSVAAASGADSPSDWRRPARRCRRNCARPGRGRTVRVDIPRHRVAGAGARRPPAVPSCRRPPDHWLQCRPNPRPPNRQAIAAQRVPLRLARRRCHRARRRAGRRRAASGIPTPGRRDARAIPDWPRPSRTSRQLTGRKIKYRVSQLPAGTDA